LGTITGRRWLEGDVAETVLIVEDNEDTAELLQAQLEGRGWEVVTARNGQEAILLLGHEPPDVVIMDLMMPELDGLETTRYFKLRFRDKFVPILVLSAKSDAESREAGARVGCDDYIGKPHSKQQLLDAVDALLAVAKVENALRASPAAAGKDALIARRKAIAQRLLGEQSPSLARRHLERVLELAPDDVEAQGLLERVG
jgi:DNA-binding response OmpR family regulator